QEKKIFMVQGPYPVIRSLLRARGWVERKLPGAGSQPEQHHGSQKEQLQEEKEEEEEEERGGAELGETSYLVRDQMPYFIWTNSCSAVDSRQLRRDQVVNHYPRVSAFATKQGLCLTMRNLPWFEKADPDAFFPRCYRLGAADERQAFIEDFRLTAARNLLKLALERDKPAATKRALKSGEAPGEHAELGLGEGERGVWVEPAPPQLVEEALHICGQHLGSLGHQDIDGDPLSPRMTDSDWNRFLQDYYRVVHDGASLVLSGAQREQCQTLLQRLGGRLPQVGIEGDHNIWILKPGAKSRGRGIVCTARLEEVLQRAGDCGPPFVREGDWVVQKYVERPLLIFGTKFDVRQWFLVTDWNPLTIWFYRESYVRFCSQPFSL
ncbi:TTLL3 monoglycylase, partial [Lophotis ruficrista]|nr:TTLL3 monoglycylase [Lophotis ruficrista]